MADHSDQHGESGLITITVKTPKEKHSVQVMEGASVRELKEQVHKKFNAPIEQLCIIFAGKIIKDDETLQQHGIKNGLTVHLVVKSADRTTPDAPTIPTSSSPSGAPDISQTPFDLGGIGGLAGLSRLGVGSANFMEMQQRLQREMMSNPDTMRQLMDNPFIQSMMSNPEIMRSLIMNNPQMRELMERNPEITHMLNNPDLMRQTMELVRNPAMMQELMRSQDRAMSNLESIPGGFNALQRMYRDIQEPMISAAQETVGSNPFASLVSNGSGGNTQQGRENTAPLPNPWGGPTNTSGSTRPAATALPGTQSLTEGMFTSPGMQSLMQQIMQNPQMMSNMLQAPYMQSVMQSLSSNPELAQQVITNNPLFANSPQMQASMSGMMPTLLQQMQNPEIQNVVTNPRALEAMMQIQSGLNLLQQESPNLFSGLTGLRTVPATTTEVSASSTVSPATTPLGSTTTSSAQAFSSLMVQMMAGGQQNQPPEERYASQLEQLATMGFVDREANIRALTATSGDVNAAIDRLLHQR